MGKTMAVVHYECKLQLTRAATWCVLLAALAVSLLDNFPSPANLHRLEFLKEPAYFLCRTMSQDGLLLIFGLMFLLSNRIPVDEKTGVRSLLMAAPVQKPQYVLGKLLGGFFSTLTVLTAFLAVSMGIYAAALYRELSLWDCLVPIAKTWVFSALPVSFFLGSFSVALPALLDIRLFYLLASGLFLINVVSVGSSEQMPFYLITSGDLIKLVWQHPKWPFLDVGSVLANLAFLAGGGAGLWLLLLLKRKFWRSEE